MSAKFDLEAAERRLSKWESGEFGEADLALALIPALSEIRRLLGVVHASHSQGPRWDYENECACPDCAAWRSSTEAKT